MNDDTEFTVEPGRSYTIECPECGEEIATVSVDDDGKATINTDYDVEETDE